ncbi:pseudouridine synthase [Sphingobacterium litopenaei]|uniref:Pseudouridylate synthase n=1 Tax=Sphingobacterium litopenaei TaxID=2763500 RepID=A0ABR7YCW6_9SPHI|nr:pseudouridine synthase [Sphingobacterium litopenaei]MBD1429125.1 pseudouridylate synthase [Sphingobacterium litopenaei]
MLEILYRDEHLIAINKPHGLLVHRSSIANDASEFALQLLRDQIGQPVYPAHRLDRKTGGILLFSLDKETDQKTQVLFQDKKMDKLYLAILRGYCPEEGTIDYPLLKENGTSQEAITHYKRLATAEIDVPQGKFPTSRYSLVEANPETGRMHQLRRHFAHIMHPIIGDRPHGCNKQNKLWKERFEMDTMLLHASELHFDHPWTGKKIKIRADLNSEFKRVLSILDLQTVATF